MLRPHIKGHFGENISAKLLHKGAMKEDELIDHIIALEKYIDSLPKDTTLPTYGYLATLNKEKTFIVANNLSDAMDKMDLRNDGNGYHVEVQASIPIVY